MKGIDEIGDHVDERELVDVVQVGCVSSSVRNVVVPSSGPFPEISFVSFSVSVLSR